MRQVTDKNSPGIRRRLAPALLVVAGAAIAVLWWTRPWADSVMIVTVTATTDEEGSVVVHEDRALFSSRRRSPPVVRARIDLRPWAGKLVLLTLRGSASPRLSDASPSGYVACSAELTGPEDGPPIDFAGWQGGAGIGLHVGPVGPRAYRPEEGDERFAFASKGDLWHVLRVPEGARLELSLKPLLGTDIAGRPPPAAPRTEAPRRRAAISSTAVPERRPDVFIYLIDALRADHLGCYGYHRDTSPNIDAFAEEATVYERAETASTWTRPSVATLLSGIYPMVHGAMHESEALDDWPVLLPEMLQQAGYYTCCVVTNGNVAASLGFDQGYDAFIWQDRAWAAWVNSRAQDALAGLDPEQPVFMYLHTIEPHDPYTPRRKTFRIFDRGFSGTCDGSVEALEEAGCVRPDLSKEDIEYLVDLYDAEVHEADAGFGGFLNVLRDAGRLHNALVVLVSDHGEAFGEHNTLCHGWSLNQEEMRVPLVVRFPRGRGVATRMGARVSLIDLVPTVLAEVGLAPELDYALPGRCLAVPTEGGEMTADGRAYGEVSIRPNNDHDLVGVIDEDGFKRVIDVSVLPRETVARESIGLWDTGADPAEATDLAASMPVRAAYGEQLIAQWLNEQRSWRDSLGVAAPPSVELTDEVRANLRALGYLR
jgi:arylsulfatase A-like enzyme